MRIRSFAIVALISCGPRVDESADGGGGGGEDPGSCDAPAPSARIGIALTAGVLFPARIDFLQDGTAIDCASDLSCSRSERLELERGFIEGRFDDPADLTHVYDECKCEDVGTSASDENCDESVIEATTLQIDSVTEDCITGSIQERTADTPTPFVATLCR